MSYNGTIRKFTHRTLQKSAWVWLQEKFEAKKNLLNTEKKINHSYKVQYKILEGKIGML